MLRYSFFKTNNTDFILIPGFRAAKRMGVSHGLDTSQLQVNTKRKLVPNFS